MDIIQFLPEGSSIIAVVVIVILFLRHQREQMRDWKEAIGTYNERIRQVTVDFNVQINKLTLELVEAKKSYQEQVKDLFDKFFALSRETITSILEMKTALLNKKLEEEQDRNKNAT